MASSKAVPISLVFLRLLTLLSTVAAVVLIATAKVKNADGVDLLGVKNFKEVKAYRYVMATASTGGAYSLLQMPLALYFASNGKRILRYRLLPEFDFYADKIIALLLATGVGVGFGVTFDEKDALSKSSDQIDYVGVDFSSANKFLDQINIATGMLLVGTVAMAIVSVLSSIIRSKTSKGGFFG